MRIPWKETRCILCLRKGVLTVEHIIPKAVGGRLTVRFLCKRCNDSLGSQVEPLVKRDPSIRLAVEALRDSIPDLAAEMTEGQAYIADSPRGKVRGFVKKGNFRVIAKQESDGSIIVPTQDGAKHIERILRKSGANTRAIRDAIHRYDTSAEATPIRIGDEATAVKWPVRSLRPHLEGQLLAEVVPLKIAYEFLACHLYKLAYSEDDALGEIRRAILDRGAPTSCYSVERLHANKYEPFHGLAFQGNEPHAIVLIRLFGWLAFRVHFLRVAVGPPRFVYTQRLDCPDERLARLA